MDAVVRTLRVIEGAAVKVGYAMKRAISPVGLRLFPIVSELWKLSPDVNFMCVSPELFFS
jgi:hypothetical protein